MSMVCSSLLLPMIGSELSHWWLSNYETIKISDILYSHEYLIIIFVTIKIYKVYIEEWMKRLQRAVSPAPPTNANLEDIDWRYWYWLKIFDIDIWRYDWLMLLFVHTPGYCSLIYSLSLNFSIVKKERSKLFRDICSGKLPIWYFILQYINFPEICCVTECTDILVFPTPCVIVPPLNYVPWERQHFWFFKMLLDDTTIFWKPEAIFKKVYLIPILCKKKSILPGSYWLPTGIQRQQGVQNWSSF